MKFNLSLFDNKDVVFIGVGRGRAYDGFKKFLSKNAKIRSITGLEKTAETMAKLLSYDPAKTIFVKNEGIPPSEMSVLYTTQIQLFFDLVRETGATVVGITGTKGKSTTAALTAHILKAAGKDVILAGNIGVSPLEGLAKATPETIFVLELSSYQLADLTRSPHIGACINLYNDHQNWHGSLEAYWEAKHNIMRFMGPNDLFIYNPSFPALQDWAEASSCRKFAINLTEPLDLSKAQLFGEHNRLNALIVKSIVHQFGVDNFAFENALNSFQPLDHRMQLVAKTAKHIFIDDAIGMTPESTSASLKAVTRKYGPVGCLLLGGQDRSYDFTELMGEIAAAKVPCLVMFPETVAKMKAALPAGYQPQILETESMAEAVKWANDNAPASSVVLLSTAAPSYLLWSGFEEKGDKFQTAIHELSH